MKCHTLIVAHVSHKAWPIRAQWRADMNLRKIERAIESKILELIAHGTLSSRQVQQVDRSLKKLRAAVRRGDTKNILVALNECFRSFVDEN